MTNLSVYHARQTHRTVSVCTPANASLLGSRSSLVLDEATASVRALDALLNWRIAAATTDVEVNRWLSLKGRIKRALTTVPAPLVEAEAAAALHELARHLAWLRGCVERARA